MRVILKSKNTERYFGNVGDWVASEQEAHAFDDVSNAFQFCSRHQLKDTVVVLKFGAGLEDLALHPPLAEARA